MSIESELIRIQNNVAAAYAAVHNMGGEVPASPNSANLAAAINSIPSGGGITIEEYNTEDGWRVRKWSDGYIEMMIKQSQDITKFSTINNVPFKSSSPAFGPVDFPVTLTEKYSEEVILLKNEPAWSWFIFKSPVDAANVLSKTCGFSVMYGFSNTGNPSPGLVTACTRVTGRWK